MSCHELSHECHVTNSIRHECHAANSMSPECSELWHDKQSVESRLSCHGLYTSHECHSTNSMPHEFHVANSMDDTHFPILMASVTMCMVRRRRKRVMNVISRTLWVTNFYDSRMICYEFCEWHPLCYSNSPIATCVVRRRGIRVTNVISRTLWVMNVVSRAISTTSFLLLW